MPVAHTKKIALKQRRERIANLYIQGWTQAAIAEHLGFSQPTISSDLRKIQEAWRESMVRDFDMARELELKKLDRIEREAWAAWERSQQPAQSAHISDETNQRKTRRLVKNQYGDPRFLELVNRSIAQRCALLGLNKAPVEVDSDGHTIVERRDRIVTIIAALRERSGAGAAGEGLVLDQPRLLCASGERGTLDAGPTPGLP